MELVQKLRKTPRRIDTLGEANPLTGLLYCAECGAKMYNHRSKGGSNGKLRPYDVFDCSSYMLGSHSRSAACCGHYITTKAVRALLLETIRAVSTFAISDRDGFIQSVRETSQVKQADAAKATRRKLDKDRRRCSELDTIIKTLYESYATGRISEERFDALLAEYEAEQKMLREGITEAEGQLAAYDEDTDRANRFLELAEKYTDFSELTTPRSVSSWTKSWFTRRRRSTGNKVFSV